MKSEYTHNIYKKMRLILKSTTHNKVKELTLNGVDFTNVASKIEIILDANHRHKVKMEFYPEYLDVDVISKLKLKTILTKAYKKFEDFIKKSR